MNAGCNEVNNWQMIGKKMTDNRFIAMVGALVWRRADGKFLLLKRAQEKDFAAGEWECVTGRVEHGESFSAAVKREALEELGKHVQVEFIIGTAHFYRGAAVAELETLGVYYGCSIENEKEIRISSEHADSKWVAAQEVEDLFPDGHWLKGLIKHADMLRRNLPEELQQFGLVNGLEIT